MGNSCSPGCRWWCLDGVFLCCLFSLLVSWMGSETYVIESVSDGFLTYFCFAILVCFRFLHIYFPILQYIDSEKIAYN